MVLEYISRMLRGASAALRFPQKCSRTTSALRVLGPTAPCICTPSLFVRCTLGLGAQLASATLLCCVLVFFSGCLKSQPVTRLVAPQGMAVAVVHDFGSELGDVPGELRTQIEGVLSARNLTMQAVPREQYGSEFALKRASRDRLRTLAGVAGGAPLQLLVETRAEYYSQLGGRYRWTVYVKFSLAKAGDPGPASVSSFSFPVLLSFDHQREEEALADAAGPIARKLGQELDDFLAGLDFKTNASVEGETKGTPELESIYFVMLDRFANGSPENDGAIDLSDPQAFHGGDLKGLIEKLDHIQSLGFRTVWLSPLFSMRTEKIGEHGAFHGYWTEDLREVESRFGNTADLLLLKKELARRDMSLVMDMVLNHVGYETKFARERPSWFHGKGDIKDWDDPVQLTTHDVHGLPDLDQNNPAVYDYLLSASAKWIEALAPIGFRLDAVKHVGAPFWAKYTRDIQKKSSAPMAMIGELYNGNPAAIADGFREDGFSHLFDFPLYFAMNEVFCKGEDVGRLAAILSLDRLYPDPSRLITFADNHDLPRVWSACGEDQKRVEALMTFMLSARGIPSVNYGTEMLLSGGEDPANRKDMRFADEGPMSSLIQRLLALRQDHNLFQSGADLPWHVEAQRYAYFRVGQTEAALIAINLGSEPWTIQHPTLASGTAKDALSGEAISASGALVSPGSTRILLLGDSDSPAYRDLRAESRKPKPLRDVVVLAEAEASELRLVGGGPELGNWNPLEAPQGERLSDGRFRFELAMPLHSTGAFKLVRMNKGEAEWEERGNRFVTARPIPGEPLEVRYGQAQEGSR